MGEAVSGGGEHAERRALLRVDVMSNLNELAAVLGEGLITDREVIEGYRCDRAAWAKAGEPLALSVHAHRKSPAQGGQTVRRITDRAQEDLLQTPPSTFC